MFREGFLEEVSRGILQKSRLSQGPLLCRQGWGPSQGSGYMGLPGLGEIDKCLERVVWVQCYDGGEMDRKGPVIQGRLSI